jgi:hypothetical protein
MGPRASQNAVENTLSLRTEPRFLGRPARNLTDILIGPSRGRNNVNAGNRQNSDKDSDDETLLIILHCHPDLTAFWPNTVGPTKINRIKQNINIDAIQIGFSENTYGFAKCKSCRITVNENISENRNIASYIQMSSLTITTIILNSTKKSSSN